MRLRKHHHQKNIQKHHSFFHALKIFFNALYCTRERLNRHTWHSELSSFTFHEPFFSIYIWWTLRTICFHSLFNEWHPHGWYAAICEDMQVEKISCFYAEKKCIFAVLIENYVLGASEYARGWWTFELN